MPDDPKPTPNTGPPAGPADDAGLKSALEKERQARQALEAQVKKLTDAAEAAETAKQAAEDAKKTDVERLSAEVKALNEAAAKKEAADLRLAVAMAKAPEGMPASKVQSLAKRLTGSTKEELEKDADELLSDFTPTKAGSAKEEKNEEKEAEATGPFGRRETPKEELTPGATGKQGEGEDPEKIAKDVLAGVFI